VQVDLTASEVTFLEETLREPGYPPSMVSTVVGLMVKLGKEVVLVSCPCSECISVITSSRLQELRSRGEEVVVVG